jgi:transcription antitermination protein NusB
MTDPAPKLPIDIFSELAQINATQVRGSRSFARLAAVQALYQMDMAQTDIADVLAQFETYRFPVELKPDEGEPAETVSRADPTSADADGILPASPDHAFFADIVRGVVRLQSDIDPALDGLLASGWRLGRIDSILRAILRSAAYELQARGDVPARVIINDYVDVAHSFFAGDEPKVTNAVLDKLAKKLRPKEFAGRGGPAP